jgi:acetyl-CoA C-acetyltransferase
MAKSVILGACRTPFGRFGGGLASLSAVDLGAHVIKNAVARSCVDPKDVEHLTMGCVVQAGQGQVVSRQAAFKAGLSKEVTTETINKVCASGMLSVAFADMYIRLGEYSVVVAGGMESMSNAPYLLRQARWGYRMGDATIVDTMVYDGLTCPIANVHMAVHASNVAKELGVSREEQDAWALQSHRKAIAAIDAGRMAEEIVPVEVKDRKKGIVVIDTDEGPRRDTTVEALAKLPPVFLADGTVTAGNAPGINDGASALVVTSEEYALAHGLKPWATILGHTTVAWDPPYLALVPAMSGRKLLDKLGLSVQDLTVMEINEAFASVAIVSSRRLEAEVDRVNVNGGAVALGHPIGASGARILTTMIYELRRRGSGLGLAAICSGTGQGDAMLLRVE